MGEQIIRVIQVGIGGMGNAWIRAVQSSSEVEYAGFVEISDAIADEQAAQYGLARDRIYKSLDEALGHLQGEKIDGVIDITPPQFHKSVSLTALNAGIPVLSEKPLASTLNDAQMIVAQANTTGVLHMVAQNYRYSPVTQTAKQVLASGELGVVGSVSVEFYKGVHFGGFRDEMAYPLVIDMAIHHFDLMRFFLGSDVVSVFGRSWNPAWSWYKGDAAASLSFGFANGVAVNYNGSWCATGRETPWNGNWRFDCEHGILSVVDDVVYVQRLTGLASNGFNQTYTEPTPIPLVELAHSGQAYLLHEFYEAVTQGKRPATTCQDNLNSLQMVFGAVQSFETGQIIQVA